MPVTRRMRKNSRNRRSVRRKSYSRNRKLNRSQKMRGGQRNNKRKRSKRRSYKMRGGSESGPRPSVAELAKKFGEQVNATEFGPIQQKMMEDPKELGVMPEQLNLIKGYVMTNPNPQGNDIFIVTDPGGVKGIKKGSLIESIGTSLVNKGNSGKNLDEVKDLMDPVPVRPPEDGKFSLLYIE